MRRFVELVVLFGIAIMSLVVTLAAVETYFRTERVLTIMIAFIAGGTVARIVHTVGNKIGTKT